MEHMKFAYGPMRERRIENFAEKRHIGPDGERLYHSLTNFERYDEELFAEHDVVEIMAHPAYVDFPILTGSSFNTPRAAETELLMSREAREVIEGLDDVSLASFAIFHK